jgi:hypothetical protein
MVPLSARLTLLLNPGSLASWRLKWFAVRLGAQRTTACCIAHREAAARVDTRSSSPYRCSGTIFVERIPERPDGLFRHRRMAPGGAFRFQGCGTVTCSSRSQLAPDSSRPPARVIFAGSTPTPNAVVSAMTSSRSSIPSWPRWRRTRPGPRPHQRADSPELTPRQGRIGCCLRG